MITLMLLLNLAGAEKLRRLAPLAFLILAGSLARDLTANARPFWRAEDVRPYHHFLTTHWALSRWSREEVPVRYLEPGNELSNRALTLSDFEHFRQIASLHGYHPVNFQRYYDLLSALQFASPQMHPNLLRLFAVNYLIWPIDLPAPPGYQQVGEHENQRLLYNPDNAYVLAPRAFRVVKDWPAVLEALAQPDFNSNEVTLLTADQLETAYDDRIRTVQSLKLQARVNPLGPGDIQIITQARRQGAMTVSEPAAPGWRVWIDGRREPLLPQVADGFFLAIVVPSGRSEVMLRYDPVSQRLGLYVTLLALAAMGHACTRRKPG